MSTSADRSSLSGVVGLVLLGAGCVGVQGTARESFSQLYHCPAQRVIVSKETGRPYLPAPPPEIANDPERLAMYEHRKEVVWLAKGCNEQAYYRCYRPVITEPAWHCDRILPPTPRAVPAAS